MKDLTKQAAGYTADARYTGIHLAIVEQLPALRRFAQRLVGRGGDAEDLVQETVMRALNAAQQFEPGTALKSWLFTIMRNAFCTTYRHRRREHVGLPDALAASLSAPPSQDWAVQRNEMQSALARLPSQIRQSLLLVALGTSYDETARICHCEVGTVKSRVNRGRAALTLELGSMTRH